MSQSNVRTHCAPTNYDAPTPDTLFHNNGDGTFTDVSASAGLARTLGNGLGIACGDFDRDGRLDFYVTNDGMPNRLWLNKGDGRFEDGALLAGCALNMNGVAEAHGVRVAEAGAGVEGVFYMRIEGVLGIEDRGDPTLGPVGRGIARIALGDDRDLAHLCHTQGVVHPGQA